MRHVAWILELVLKVLWIITELSVLTEGWEWTEVCEWTEIFDLEFLFLSLEDLDVSHDLSNLLDNSGNIVSSLSLPFEI